MGGERESNSVLLEKIGYFVLAYLINAQIGGCSGEDEIYHRSKMLIRAIVEDYDDLSLSNQFV